MTNANNDVRELEDLLTELEGQGALPVGAYAEEDDAVTQLMDAPLGEQEWMVQITPQDRRMMSTDQLLAELLTGHLVTRDMLVWRSGMGDWAPISRVDELRSGASLNVPLPPPAPAPRPLAAAPLPPPTPIPPPRVPTGQSSALSSPSPLGRAPLPPAPSVPFAAPRPFTPVPDVPPPSPLPLLSSPFGSSPAPVVPSKPSAALLPDLESAFNVPPAADRLPVPPPAIARVNTQRPVAVDFSEMEPTRSAPVRVLVGSGIAALLMIAGTVYGLSAGGVFSSGAEPTPEVAAASAKPAPAKPAAAPEAPKPAEPAPVAAAAAAAEPAKEEPQTQPVSMKEEPAPAAEEKKVEAAVPEAKAAKEPEAKAQAEEPEAKAEKPSKAEKAAKSEKAEEKAEASDDSAAPSSAAEQRMARRLKALSKKKASAAASDDAEASASPRRSSKPRAAAAAPEVARAEESEEAPKDKVTTTDPAGSTFNRGAAKTALENAATQAKNCRPQGGPSGTGRVQVRYEPNGKVGAVSILSPQFENTTTGSCVVMVFRRASIPAFTGSPAVSMNHNFEIPSN